MRIKDVEEAGTGLLNRGSDAPRRGAAAEVVAEKYAAGQRQQQHTPNRLGQ